MRSLLWVHEDMQYPRSNDRTPRLSDFVPDLVGGVGPTQSNFETSRLSSFMPVGPPLGSGSSFMGQQRALLTPDPSMNLPSFMTAQHPIGRASSPMGMSNKNFSDPYSSLSTNEPSGDLEQFMPGPPPAYNHDPQSGLATEYTPRLSHCVPQLR